MAVNKISTMPSVSDLNRIKQGALYFLDKGILHANVGNYRSHIMNATSPSAVVSAFTRPCMLAIIECFYQLMSVHDLSEALATAWTYVESPNMDANLTKAKAVRLFAMCNPKWLMSPSELIVFEQLPDVITVYRGLGKRNADNVKALSWTLDREIAEWFAKRFDSGAGEYEVYKANVNKKDIFAFFNSREEKEIVLNYRKLYDIQCVTRHVDTQNSCAVIDGELLKQ